ncbi:MAG: PEP-CTERM sorting domain-containing protein [Opitutaceae bacterium]|nr:PEP-CTERM sorting domain-containing protein [Opitutaceae bacterium]
MKASHALILTLLSSSVSLAVYGQPVLLGWDVNGVSEATASLSAGTVGANISTNSPSGVLSRGSGVGLAGSPLSNGFGASGFTSGSLADAITNNDYFTFSITVDYGYTMSLDSIIFKASETTSGPTNAALLSTVGGFNSESAVSTWLLPSASNSDQSITLSALDFSHLTGTVEFRIYAWGGSGISTTDKYRFRDLTGNDLVISGTTALAPVPEPSTYAAILGGVAFVGVMAIRRRKPAANAA